MTLLADLGGLLEHVGERGLPLTDTGRLRLADIRAINAGLAEPQDLERKIRDRAFPVRREDEAWRVHFLRLLAQAAGLLDARLGRVRRTARARGFARLPSEEAARRLFAGWWWKGAWDLISPGALDQWFAADRAATAEALIDLGTAQHALERVGARLRGSLAGVAAPTHPLLDEEAWGFAAWRVCLRPLAAFDGCVPTYVVEEINGYPFEHLSAVRVTDQGRLLLRAALESRPAAAPRVRRGMAAPWPAPRSRASARVTSGAEDPELRERVLAEHPEYRAALGRGEDHVGGINARAHIVTHEAIEEQLGANDPPEARAAYERLLGLGEARHDVMHALADVLVREVWQAQHEHRAFDTARYAARLAAIPEPGDGDEPPIGEITPARLAPKDGARLRKLPRSSAEWEADLAEFPIEIEGLGAPLCVIWGDARDGTIRAFHPDVDTEPGQLALDAFTRAAIRPQVGVPELPSRVRAHTELADSLRAALGELGIAVEATDELPAVHRAIESFRQFLDDPALDRGPGPPTGRSRRR